MKDCKKLVKKIFCFVILSALVVTMYQPVFSYAQEESEELQQMQDKNIQNLQQPADNSEEDNQQYDTTKPVIERAESPQQGQTLKAGDTIYLYVYAYDTDSGIKDLEVNAGYENGRPISEEVSYDAEKKCYVWKHVLENISGNKLIITDITATDKVGHTSYKSLIENGEYTIWTDVEWQKPEATDVWVKNISFKQNGKRVDEDQAGFSDG